MSHTPGPWSYENCGRSSGHEEHITTRHDTLPNIAQVFGSKRSQADAALIAAAPDLYAALDRIVRNCRDADCGDHCSNSCMFCQARAALAKARADAD